ncbi:hypothetical protein Tco_0390610 [Tanacetum coccineum]
MNQPTHLSKVNVFVPMDTESSRKKVDSSRKKAESSKKRTRAVLGEERCQETGRYLAYYLNGDFPPVSRNKETQVLKVVSFEEQTDELKKKLAKNNEAKMVLYNVLPKKEYERIFMCRTAKDIWQSLFITHQDNSKVKDNKIDLLVQQYKQFTIFEEESIDSDFARFNTIITSLKALDEGFYSKNYVRKFLRALHPKWRAKVTMIEGSKDLSSLALDELIDNLKVHEVVMEKDSKIYKGKKKRAKSIALKAKK